MVRAAALSVTLLFISLIAMAGLAGCLRTGAVGEVQGAQNVKVSLTRVDAEWSPGLGCYWTAEGFVYNSGDLDANHVEVDLHLVNTRTGAIKDSRSVTIGALARGGSQSFAMKMDGECGETYRVDARVLES